MAFPISAVLGGLQGIGGIVGMLGAKSAQRRAEEALRLALAQAQYEMDTSLQNQRETNRRSLYAATGQGGDALRALAGQMGDRYANAGVWNASTVSGGLNNAQANLNTSLLDLANRNDQNILQQQADNQRYLTNLKVGQANQDLGYARQDYGNAAGGLQSYINSLATTLLQQRGVPNARTLGPATNGMQGSTPPSVLDTPGVNNNPFNFDYSLSAPSFSGLKKPRQSASMFPAITLGRQPALAGGWNY